MSSASCLLPGTVYVMPIAAGAAGLPPGKTWVSVPLTGSGRVGVAFVWTKSVCDEEALTAAPATGTPPSKA